MAMLFKKHICVVVVCGVLFVFTIYIIFSVSTFNFIIYFLPKSVDILQVIISSFM